MTYAYFLFECVDLCWLRLRLIFHAQFIKKFVQINWSAKINRIRSQQRSTHSNKKYSHVTTLLNKCTSSYACKWSYEAHPVGHAPNMCEAHDPATRTYEGPEHTGHFVQPHVAAHCGEHTRATCGGDMYVMYANALSVAGTSHSLWHTWATNCSVLAKAWK